MQKNTIKAKLKAGGEVVGTCLTDYLSTEAVTVIKAAGLDYFFIDTEHSRAGFGDIQTLSRVARAADVIPLVRVTDSEYHLIARTLDCGAMGIIAPRVDTVEQVEKIVAAMKFPPAGRRGYGLRSIVTDLNYRGARTEMESSDQETMVIIQMETKACLEDIERITAVEGVDATMVGPFDLTVSLGIPGDFDNPKLWDAFDRMVAACKKNGVAPGVHAGNPAMLKKCREHGARFLTCGSDASVLLQGFRAIRAEFPVRDAEESAGGYA